MFTANYDRKSLSFIETNFMKTRTDIALLQDSKFACGLFVLVRVISWNVFDGSRRTIHEITRTNTNKN